MFIRLFIGRVGDLVKKKSYAGSLYISIAITNIGDLHVFILSVEGVGQQKCSSNHIPRSEGHDICKPPCNPVHADIRSDPGLQNMSYAKVYL